MRNLFPNGRAKVSVRVQVEGGSHMFDDLIVVERTSTCGASEEDVDQAIATVSRAAAEEAEQQTGDLDYPEPEAAE